MDALATHAHNRLLAGLPAADLQLLSGRMRIVPLRAGVLLHEPGSEINEVYFPLAGAVSLGVVTQNSEVIETAVIGRDGTVGGITALDARIGCSRAGVHIEGKAAAIYIGHLRRIAGDSAAIRSMLLRYHEFVLCQAQWTAACNAAHSLEQRLCRVLLRFSHATDNQPLTLTQHLLAEQLGVKRTSVSLIAHRMRQAGILRIHRGRMELLKPEAVQNAACECSERINRYYEMLFAADREQQRVRDLPAMSSASPSTSIFFHPATASNLAMKR